MTIKELKDKIKNLPDDMDVLIEQTNDESRFGMAENVSTQRVTFIDEEIDPEEWPLIQCLVISDEA